jgi:hypothetical protein
MTLKWILRKWDGVMDEIDLAVVAGSCKCDYEPSGSIKCREFLDFLRTGQLLMKDCAPWSE